MVQRYTYDLYGKPTLFLESDAQINDGEEWNRFLFTGRGWFGKLELYDHRNRYYNPELGRWLTRDPIQEYGGINLFGYVGNDPVNWLDAFGLDRVLYFFGHMWIILDTYDESGQKNGECMLDFAPSFDKDESDFRIDTADPVYPSWFPVKRLATSWIEDESLLAQWQAHRRANVIRYNIIPNNCITIALKMFWAGIPKAPPFRPSLPRTPLEIPRYPSRPPRPYFPYYGDF
jgi:RHS repeat-associated protein